MGDTLSMLIMHLLLLLLRCEEFFHGPRRRGVSAFC